MPKNVLKKVASCPKCLLNRFPGLCRRRGLTYCGVRIRDLEWGAWLVCHVRRVVVRGVVIVVYVVIVGILLEPRHTHYNLGPDSIEKVWLEHQDTAQKWIV